MRLAPTLLAMLLLGAPAAWAVDADMIKSTAGYWFLADAASGKGCNLHLLADEAIGGHGIEAPESCTVGKTSGGDLAAWNLDGQGGLIILDAVRHVLFRLAGEEDGSWRAESSAGTVTLTPSEKTVVALPTAAAAAGTWQLARPGGQPLCRLTLANRPQASGEGNLALTVAAGCDRSIATLGFDGWMIEGVAVVLHGSGDHSLAFIADGKGGFVKDPKEGGRPLAMTRTP